MSAKNDNDDPQWLTQLTDENDDKANDNNQQETKLKVLRQAKIGKNGKLYIVSREEELQEKYASRKARKLRSKRISCKCVKACGRWNKLNRKKQQIMDKYCKKIHVTKKPRHIHKEPEVAPELPDELHDEIPVVTQDNDSGFYEWN